MSEGEYAYNPLAEDGMFGDGDDVGFDSMFDDASFDASLRCSTTRPHGQWPRSTSEMRGFVDWGSDDAAPTSDSFHSDYVTSKTATAGQRQAPANRSRHMSSHAGPTARMAVHSSVSEGFQYGHAYGLPPPTSREGFQYGHAYGPPRPTSREGFSRKVGYKFDPVSHKWVVVQHR
jgi:hypothetical protein